MLKIDGTTIKLTRGDSMYTEVAMIKSDGTPYEPQVGDVIRFGLKKSAKDTECLIQKVISNDDLILHLEPNDTKPFAFGKYVYDVEITFANGDVDTFINNQPFNLVDEVI